MQTWFQNSKSLPRASHAGLHQNYSPLLSKQPNYFSKLYNSILIQKIENSRSLSQSAISNHSTVFTFTLPLSEGPSLLSHCPYLKDRLYFHTALILRTIFTFTLSLSEGPSLLSHCPYLKDRLYFHTALIWRTVFTFTLPFTLPLS
jgi:hypothetical protein